MTYLWKELVLDIPCGTGVLEDIPLSVHIGVELSEGYAWCERIWTIGEDKEETLIDAKHSMFKQLKNACEKWCDDNYEVLRGEFLSKEYEFYQEQRRS